VAALWAGRYFERQSDNKCGRHALNNVLGGPQFLDIDLQSACMDVVSRTGEFPLQHARSDGWYSHGVLAAVFDRLAPPAARLIDRPLLGNSFYALLSNTRMLGAIVNHSNVHWTAIVKHAACVWHVDSRTWPILLTGETYKQLLERNPMTFVLVTSDFDE
jgi:hypothetical protein